MIADNVACSFFVEENALVECIILVFVWVNFDVSNTVSGSLREFTKHHDAPEEFDVHLWPSRNRLLT